MTIVTTSSKGQVVIPKIEREKLGIKPGAKVLIELAGDHIEVRPLPENPVEHFCGVFSEGTSLTDALLRERKEDLRREEEKTARLIRPSRISKKRKRA